MSLDHSDNDGIAVALRVPEVSPRNLKGRQNTSSSYSPNYPLRARTDRLEVLVALQDGELGVPDLDRVKHGGQPGCHVRPQVRHAPRCSSLLLLHLRRRLHPVHPAGALLVRSTGTYALSHFGREIASALTEL